MPGKAGNKLMTARRIKGIVRGFGKSSAGGEGYKIEKKNPTCEDAPVLPADDITSLQPITGLSRHVPFMQEETAEVSDWLQRHMTGESAGRSGGTRTVAASQIFFYFQPLPTSRVLFYFFSKLWTTPLNYLSPSSACMGWTGVDTTNIKYLINLKHCQAKPTVVVLNVHGI